MAEPSGPAALPMVDLDGGDFLMGTDDSIGYPGDGEAPSRTVSVSPFAVAATTVTNAEFAAFVDATGYRTESEHWGWSFVFGGLLPDDFPDTRGVVGAEWWRQGMLVPRKRGERGCKQQQEINFRMRWTGLVKLQGISNRWKP